jgi:hypothetical protein
MQAAHNTGQLVYYPQGTYRFSNLTIHSGGIAGDGLVQSVLESTDTSSNDAIQYTGTVPPVFKEFQLTAIGTKAGGSGINICPTPAAVPLARFRDVSIGFFPTGLSFTAATTFKVDGCYFWACTQNGIYVSNVIADAGDSEITGCMFGVGPAANGIQQVRSGGLRIYSSKFLGGLNGYAMNLNQSTSQLFLVGNQFDSLSGYAISIQRQAGSSATFGDIMIANNTISLNVTSQQVPIYCPGGFLSAVSVLNNNVYSSTTAISLSNITAVNVQGNSVFGSPGTAPGIYIGPNTSGILGPNFYHGYTTQYQNDSGGFSRSTQRIDGISPLVFRSLGFFGGAYSAAWQWR